MLPVQGVDYADQGLFLELAEVDLAGVGIYFREVFRVHGEEGLLEVQFLGGGEDAEVAVWVVGEGL